MKNYYLKRIDELKTEIGSDRRPTPVSDITRGVLATGRLLGDPLKRTLGAAGEGLRQAVQATKRKEAAAEKEATETPSKRSQQSPDAQAQRAKDAKRLRNLRARGTGPGMRKRARDSRKDLQYNRTKKYGKEAAEIGIRAGAEYIQIGYILAESLGLL